MLRNVLLAAAAAAVVFTFSAPARAAEPPAKEQVAAAPAEGPASQRVQAVSYEPTPDRGCQIGRAGGAPADGGLAGVGVLGASAILIARHARRLRRRS